jgi:hypothetical protein
MRSTIPPSEWVTKSSDACDSHTLIRCAISAASVATSAARER